MDKTTLMVYDWSCDFKKKGQGVNCTTSKRKNADSMSVNSEVPVLPPTL